MYKIVRARQRFEMLLPRYLLSYCQRLPDHRFRRPRTGLACTAAPEEQEEEEEEGKEDEEEEEEEEEEEGEEEELKRIKKKEETEPYGYKHDKVGLTRCEEEEEEEGEGLEPDHETLLPLLVSIVRLCSWRM